MSSKSSETSSISYDPTSQSIYQGFQPQIASVLGQYSKNPLQSIFFNQRLQMANNQANQMGQAGVDNLFNNIRATGGSATNLSPFQHSILAANSRATSGLKSNAFLNLLNQAQQAQMWATGSMQGYSPLMTGQTNVGKKSSSVLPTLLGGALSFGSSLMPPLNGMGSMPFMTGGAPSASPSVTGLVPNIFQPSFPSGIFGAPAMPKLAGSMPFGGPTSPWTYAPSNPNPFTTYPAAPVLFGS